MTHENPRRMPPGARGGRRAGSSSGMRASRRPRNGTLRAGASRSPQSRINLATFPWQLVVMGIAGIAVVALLIFGVVTGVRAIAQAIFPPAVEETAGATDTTGAEDANASSEAQAEDANTAAAENPSGPNSTPKESWQKGTVPELFQTDATWANESYAGGTMAKNACGPTCMAMVYIALTGDTSMGPVEMANFCEQNGYVENNATTWDFMTTGASQLGLTSTGLNADAETVTAELQAGHPIIVNVGPGSFTSVGHFIVLTGVDESGKIWVHNPNAPEDNKVSWDFNIIARDARSFWSFSA